MAGRSPCQVCSFAQHSNQHHFFPRSQCLPGPERSSASIRWLPSRRLFVLEIGASQSRHFQTLLQGTRHLVLNCGHSEGQACQTRESIAEGTAKLLLSASIGTTSCLALRLGLEALLAGPSCWTSDAAEAFKWRFRSVLSCRYLQISVQVAVLESSMLIGGLRWNACISEPGAGGLWPGGLLGNRGGVKLARHVGSPRGAPCLLQKMRGCAVECRETGRWQQPFLRCRGSGAEATSGFVREPGGTHWSVRVLFQGLTRWRDWKIQASTWKWVVGGGVA